MTGRTVRDQPGSLRFAVRVKPNAPRDRVGGRWAAGDTLLVAVAAPAVDDKANEAVCRALAAAFGVRRADVEIVVGHRSRDKVVRLHPAPAGSAGRLDDLLAAGT